MKRDTEIRVATEKKYTILYNDLKKYDVISDFRELFFVCVCLAYKKKRNAPLKAGEDRFRTNSFTPREWATYYAIFLKDNNMDFATLKDEKTIMKHMESYANAGMEILLEEFLEDYVKITNGEPHLIPIQSRELPKSFIQYLLSEAGK
jgi:hypothetical protein